MQITRKQKEIVKDFEVKILVECHDLYLKRDTLLMTDVFENFSKMRIGILNLIWQGFLQPQD